jgi:hypothetical protein
VHVHNLVMSQLRAEPELRNRHPVETPEIYGAESSATAAPAGRARAGLTIKMH